MIFEVAYSQRRRDHSQRRRDLEQVMAGWVGPAGPARVVVGVDIQCPHPTNTPPRLEVLLQLGGQARPGAVVQYGAGSGCVSPYMYDHTLWVPVNELLYGVPWTVRLLVSLYLAWIVPVLSVLWGGHFAVEDVLRGRRRLLDVVCATVRSLGGPWWGAVPLDTFEIRTRYKRFTERLIKVERDLESLEKQREELSRLLATYSKE
ncbi:hypothetical protein HXX76_014899 [Chlamydomonas incerta]|uniref:Uncharacterized protein n=1 Tax=Chlamydomonas incerta TaxID=51695 RepID=A0A835VS88_CHLIN|nr:hypothetical protein HXX76_014899 [Chlamydomonas incerta]|eukprot:KAG2423958.1 hypothetical protein HXX76_014899 [Chlamydomonas incerta]